MSSLPFKTSEFGLILQHLTKLGEFLHQIDSFKLRTKNLLNYLEKAYFLHISQSLLSQFPQEALYMRMFILD